MLATVVTSSHQMFNPRFHPDPPLPYLTLLLIDTGAEELEMYLDVLLRQAFIAPTTVPSVIGSSSSGSNDIRFTKVTPLISTIDQ